MGVDEIYVRNPYEELASAIILQACKDYKCGRLTDQEFKRFCYGQWFTLLTSVDGSYLFKRMYREVRGRNYDSKAVTS